MNDINLKYIEENYIEFEEIMKVMNLTSDKLNQLIESKLIPEASYIVNSETIISSSLNDSYKIIVHKKYFPKSVLKIIKNNAENINPENFKTQFKENLLFNLKNHPFKHLLMVMFLMKTEI
ncbi:MAG: hypothetical protein ABI793_17345 [Flavobacterium sp.]